MQEQSGYRLAQEEPSPPQAEPAENELDTFVYAVSHDLKEPLLGIETYATCLLEDYGARLDESGRELITTLLGLVADERRMIDAVHAFSTLGRTPLALEEADQMPLVSDVLDALAPELRALNVDIRVPHPLPSAYCDPRLVQGVWRNLILNAATFNDKPDKWVEIGCTRARADAGTVFYVRDNGNGIAKADWPAVFSMFTRLTRRTAGPRGVGAGLTLARRIVERHGGTLWVDSRVGEGSTFYFTLETERSR